MKFPRENADMSNEKGIVLLAILLALDKLSKVSNE